MASSELDWTVLQTYELDSTDDTAADDDEGKEKVVMDADSTSDKFADRTDARASSKLPSSEIIVRTISVERSAPLADLPADVDAAFSQWLGNSGLAPSKH